MLYCFSVWVAFKLFIRPLLLHREKCGFPCPMSQSLLGQLLVPRRERKYLSGYGTERLLYDQKTSSFQTSLGSRTICRSSRLGRSEERARRGPTIHKGNEPSIMLQPTATSIYNLQNSWDSLINPQSNSWTNNKAYNSCMRPDSNCEWCDHAETMEHLLCECALQSELLWNKLGEAFTQLFSNRSTDLVPRVELGQTNIIYNIPHPWILLYIPDKTMCNTQILLIQEWRGISYTDGWICPPMRNK
jgi:hypothetical protein